MLDAMTSKSRRRVTVGLRMSHFELPPVEGALIIGRKAPIGSLAMEKALTEMMPGTFVRVPVEHPIIEAVIVRQSHLKRIDHGRLIELLIRNSEDVIEETEALRVSIELELSTVEELDL